MRHVNPSGFVYYDNEAELCKELEEKFLPDFFSTSDNWKPILDITKEVWLDSKNRIDYFGDKTDKPTYVEVKNWWVTDKDVRQIKRYFPFVKNSGFLKFYIICGGIAKEKREYLEEQCECIEFIITKDIKELNPKEVVYWM